MSRPQPHKDSTVSPDREMWGKNALPTLELPMSLRGQKTAKNSLFQLSSQIYFPPEEVPTMLMRLWPRVRTSSRVRSVRAPPCRAWLVRRLWSNSRVWRNGRFLKDCSPSTEIWLWLRPGRWTNILIIHMAVFKAIMCSILHIMASSYLAAICSFFSS